MAEEIIETVRGKYNIEDFDSCITRVRLKLNDGSKIDKLKLKRIGVTEIIRLGSNNVQMMIENMANPIISRMRKSIKE
ncbi:PTS transporter subunit EIIB [Clostridium sp. NSJ-6]|uniref:PTS transporter subunit EIIB n=1 Tax=Clostridium hominis TaxID=2763036 RepID=A0ABR7DHX2_9CLOT|nr:PTS transporter subunit EIIB [Clostridium hominis]MBC5631035.1 PTS transporter subunit EIIB [Clostridium hominis]